MREFMIVFKQAFMTKAKAKSFIITTVNYDCCHFHIGEHFKDHRYGKNVTGTGDSKKYFMSLITLVGYR